MEPPSYEEASLHPPTLSTAGLSSPPPPSYDASLLSPQTPPPSYGEAVNIQQNPFPVLSPPFAVTSPPQNTGNVVHPHTNVNASPRFIGQQTHAAVVVTQPLPVPVAVTYLKDVPALVRCPHCHHTVTTKVTYQPGSAAWCMCVILMLMGLICGFCLIPLMVRGLQDVYHHCPQCENLLHRHTR